MAWNLSHSEPGARVTAELGEQGGVVPAKQIGHIDTGFFCTIKSRILSLLIWGVLLLFWSVLAVIPV